MGDKYECKNFSDIAKCFQMLQVHIDGEVEQLKLKQDEMDKRLEVCEHKVEFACGEIRDIFETNIPNLESKTDTKIEKESIERLKLELWGRKWNLIIRGIEGNGREPPKQTQVAVKIFLNTKLGIDSETVKKYHFTAVHRLPSGPERSRNIIVRLSSLIEREEIMAAVTKLQPGSGYSVTPDLPSPIAALRGELLKERREMSADERRKFKLIYLKEPPFVQLVKKRG